MGPVSHPPPERKRRFITQSGVEINRLYTPADLADPANDPDRDRPRYRFSPPPAPADGWNVADDVGTPGEPPFTRGIQVIPDILCSAGGLLLGYFEWVQDTQSFFWAEREIAAELERIMEAAFAGVLATAERKRVDLRGAAMMVAVGRVAEATALRGLYP